MYSYIGTPKNIDFPFGTNGKLMVLGVPIFKYFMVSDVLNNQEERSIVTFTDSRLWATRAQLVRVQRCTLMI